MTKKLSSFKSCTMKKKENYIYLLSHKYQNTCFKMFSIPSYYTSIYNWYIILTILPSKILFLSLSIVPSLYEKSKF